jgi:S-DNA-T family DNA segregation ATPase FtsK/SpoIIIE
MPDLVEVASRARAADVKLWARRRGDADAGAVAFGIGDVPWEPSFACDGRDRPTDVTDHDPDCGRLSLVPVGEAIGPGCIIGVCGPRTPAVALVRAVLVQVAVHHGPSDVAIAILADSGEEWDWVKWLPHTRQGGGARWLGSNDSASVIVPEILRSDRGRQWTVVVLDGARFHREEPATATDLLRGDRGAVAALVLADSREELPATCTTVIEIRDEDGAARCSGRPHPEPIDMMTAGLSPSLARSAALAVGRFGDPEQVTGAASLPVRVGLHELLDGDTADSSSTVARWRVRRHDEWSSPLGVVRGGPFHFDLIRDGPHALVAGTTGSGKSELLRALVVGMALSIDPEHLNFVLFDFKGGSAFMDLEGLPHVVGSVSDLDPKVATRALRSLDAEVRRRERELRDVGVTSLDDYLAGGHDEVAPMPRLLVVVDEFATMAAELPGFVDSLVSVAQRGRSLGLHLVLATQRPAGAVTPNVRANTSARIALRVEDAADSSDVIGDTDAAAIPRGAPGRGFARLGPADLVAFQGAFLSSSKDDIGESAHPTRPFRFGFVAAPSGTDRGMGGPSVAAIVAATRDAAALLGCRPTRRPWQPLLPTSLSLRELETRAAALPTGSCVIGLVDDPDRQSQSLLTWSPADGHVLAYGVAGSGASDLLVTLAVGSARRTSVEELHIYCMDFGPGVLAPLTDLPHVGAVIGAAERERQERLLRRLRQELEARRRGHRGPQLLVLLDNYAGFHAAFDDLPGLVWRDDFTRIMADGPPLGITVVATADRYGAVPASIADLVPERVVLRLADASDLALFGLNSRRAPEAVVGRGLHVPSGLELQLATVGSDLAEMVADIKTADSMQIDTIEISNRPTPIGVLPESIDIESIAAELDVTRPEWFIPLGLGDTTLEPAGLVLGAGDNAVIAGPPRSGKSTALAVIASLVARSDAVHVTAVALRPSPLRTVPANRIVTDRDGLDDALATIRRNGALHLLLVDDADLVDDPGGRLAELVNERRADLRVVVGGRADVLRTAFGHWTAGIRRSRIGVVLRPHADMDGDLLQVPLPRRGPQSFPVGRGYLINDGRVELVQLARCAGTSP